MQDSRQGAGSEGARYKNSTIIVYLTKPQFLISLLFLYADLIAMFSTTCLSIIEHHIQ